MHYSNSLLDGLVNASYLLYIKMIINMEPSLLKFLQGVHLSELEDAEKLPNVLYPVAMLAQQHTSLAA